MTSSGLRVRLAFLACLLGMAFLMVFQPIRMARGKADTTIKDTFTFDLGKPVIGAGENREQLLNQKRDELLRKLREANPTDPDWVDRVVVLDAPTQLRVDAVILPGLQAQQQSKQYLELILKTLKAEYPAVTEFEPKESAEAESRETPVATFWRFQVYRPTPHINLGLDLRGGLHLVLQCLPSTSFPFTAAEQHPFLGTQLTSAEFDVQAAKLQQTLKEEAQAAFVQSGVPAPRRYSFSIVTPTALEVSTVTETAEQADAYEAVLRGFLVQQFPGVTMGKPERLLLEKDTAEKVRNIIERRVNGLGVAESTIEIQGRDRLIIEIPGTKIAPRVERIVDSRALLEFKLVPEQYKLDPSRAFARGEERIWRLGDEATGDIVSEKEVMAHSERKVLGRDLKPNALVVPDHESPGHWAVQFELRNDRQQDFYAMTRTSVGQYLVILLDNQVQMAPMIQSAMMGEGIITGQFSPQEAKELALLLNGGALPVPIEIVENRTISATLGEDSINRSVRAGIVGVIIVLCFMVTYYRAPGLLADLALGIYVMLVLAIYVFIDAVLTLPGIAGFILSIGMAVDANVIIFERLKEELATAKTMRSAVEAGFNRAWTAILDSNVTTLLAAAVLYYFGTGPIRGFAVVLSIGVVCSMFSAITATRWMLTAVMGSRLSAHRNLFLCGRHWSREEAA